jgi:hypothetical protein
MQRELALPLHLCETFALTVDLRRLLLDELGQALLFANPHDENTNSSAI